MITVELDDETAAKLKEMAVREHISLAQLLRKLTLNYRRRQDDLSSSAPELLMDFAGILQNSPSFQGNPLDIQKAMRDEWS